MESVRKAVGKLFGKYIQTDNFANCNLCLVVGEIETMASEMQRKT